MHPQIEKDFVKHVKEYFKKQFYTYESWLIDTDEGEVVLMFQYKYYDSSQTEISVSYPFEKMEKFRIAYYTIDYNSPMELSDGIEKLIKKQLKEFTKGLKRYIEEKEGIKIWPRI